MSVSSAHERGRTYPEPLRATPFFTMPEEPPGFHKVNPVFMCKHPEHSFPTHLHIPAGMKFVHYCPYCHHKSVAFGVVVEMVSNTYPSKERPSC